MKTIAAVLKREITISRGAAVFFAVLLFSYLTFAASLIRVYTPISPVPFTLQTFVLFMSVYFLNGKQAGLSQVIYIAAGLIGAPVFAAGLSGAFVFVGPTAGYLVGFIVAGVLMGYAAGKLKLNYFTSFALFAAGSVLILAFGSAHLCLVYKMPVDKALLAGFAPFILTDLVKAAVAAGFYSIKK